MRNFIKSFGIIAVAVIIGLVMTGCTTTIADIQRENYGAFPAAGGNFALPLGKDFSSVGLVFTETVLERSQEKENVSASGDVLTYYGLLKEAQKLNADAIINVVIDAKIEKETSETKFLFLSMGYSGTIKETWYGSALAIKYTDKLTVTDYVLPGAPQVVVEAAVAPVGGDGGKFKLFSPKTWGNLFKKK